MTVLLRVRYCCPSLFSWTVSLLFVVLSLVNVLMNHVFRCEIGMSSVKRTCAFTSALVCPLPIALISMCVGYLTRVRPSFVMCFFKEGGKNMMRYVFSLHSLRQLRLESAYKQGKSNLHVAVLQDDANGNQHFNMWWKTARFTPSQLASCHYPYQRINHFPKSSEITRKDSLLRNLRRMRV